VSHRFIKVAKKVPNSDPAEVAAGRLTVFDTWLHARPDLLNSSILSMTILNRKVKYRNILLEICLPPYYIARFIIGSKFISPFQPFIHWDVIFKIKQTIMSVPIAILKHYIAHILDFFKFYNWFRVTITLFFFIGDLFLTCSNIISNISRRWLMIWHYSKTIWVNLK